MSEETAKKVDAEIKKIVDAGYKRAKKILTEKNDAGESNGGYMGFGHFVRKTT